MPLRFVLLIIASVLSVLSGGDNRSGQGRAGAAVSAAGVSAEIVLGFAGYVVPDTWIPLLVVLRSDRDLRGVLEAAAPHPRSTSAARVQAEVYLSAASPRAVTLPVVVRDLRAPLTVTLSEGGAVVAQWRVAVPAARAVDRLVLALSDRPVGLDRLLPGESRVRAAYVRADALPGRWQLYGGIHAVVLGDLEERRLTSTQVEALSGWIAAGGHLILAVRPGSTLLTAAILHPFLRASPRRPELTSAPERHHPWGRGTVTVVPVDPFVPGLSPEGAAVWRRVLAQRGPAALTDRRLLDVLPQSGGASAPVQLLIVLTLGGYLVALRPITAWLRRGASGAVAALLLLAVVVAAAAVLALIARTQMIALIQGAVAEALPGRDLARLEALGRLILPRGGAFVLTAGGGTLLRPLGEAETILRLGSAAELEGRAASTLPVQASALIPLPVRGSFHEDEERVSVEIRNGTGRPLDDAVIVHRQRLQRIGAIGPEFRVVLAEGEWRPLPALDVTRGMRPRLLAWALGRLRDGAIIDPTTGATTYLLAWLDQDGRVPRWGQRRSPLLIVVPLTGMGASP